MPEKPVQPLWEEPPDEERDFLCPIRSPKINKAVTGLVLSDQITGVRTYYDPGEGRDSRGKSQPCLGGPENCKGCRLGYDHRWKGYLACLDHTTGRFFVAEVTKEAYLTCEGFKTWKNQLRGKTLKLSRLGQDAQGRVTASLAFWAGDASKLPSAFDVRATLERAWFGPYREGQ